MSELTGTLSHGRHSVVLNRQSTLAAVTNQAFIYDDSSAGRHRGRPTDATGREACTILPAPRASASGC